MQYSRLINTEDGSYIFKTIDTKYDELIEVLGRVKSFVVYLYMLVCGAYITWLKQFNQ